jgi:hypothetical protein
VLRLKERIRGRGVGRGMLEGFERDKSIVFGMDLCLSYDFSERLLDYYIINV